jgi:hypothetical protein
MSKCGNINLFIVVDRFSKMWLLYLVRKLSRSTAKNYFSQMCGFILVPALLYHT